MEHCPLYEDYKMKIPTLGEVRNSVIYYSRKKQGCIADLFCNYQNCTEKRKKFGTLCKNPCKKLQKQRCIWAAFMV